MSWNLNSCSWAEENISSQQSWEPIDCSYSPQQHVFHIKPPNPINHVGSRLIAFNVAGQWNILVHFLLTNRVTNYMSLNKIVISQKVCCCMLYIFYLPQFSCFLQILFRTFTTTWQISYTLSLPNLSSLLGYFLCCCCFSSRLVSPNLENYPCFPLIRIQNLDISTK